MQVIDIIESDHAPHTIGEKQRETPTYGMPGLETTLPLLLTAVAQNRLTLDDVLRLCHDSPAKIFGIVQNPETKIVVDLQSEYEIKNENLHTKCKWSPFDGWKVKGKVTQAFLRGKKVYEDGEILTQAGSGMLLP